MTCIEKAALSLFFDPLRISALHITQQVNVHVATVVEENQHLLNANDKSVSGSTYRETHLAKPDIDVALVPRDDLKDYRSALEPLAVSLATNLLGDSELCQQCADLYRVSLDEIEDCLEQRPTMKDHRLPDTPHRDLLTAKFLLDGAAFLEVSLGRYHWLFIGLSYNRQFDGQVADLQRIGGGQNVIRYLSQILLLKWLAMEYGFYKSKNGGLDSRGLEQVVMQFAAPGSNTPLKDALERITNTACPGDIQLEMPVEEGLYERLNVPPHKRDLMRMFSEEGWARCQQMARDVLCQPSKVVHQ